MREIPQGYVELPNGEYAKPKTAAQHNFGIFGTVHLENSGAVAKLERDSGNGALAARKGKARNSGIVHVRFESVRKRLCDPDNLSPKWLLDSLRYAGIICGDEPDKITLEVTQRKCAKGEAEHTLITITPL